MVGPAPPQPLLDVLDDDATVAEELLVLELEVLAPDVAPVEVAPVEVAPDVAPVAVAPVAVAPVAVAPVAVAPVEVALVEVLGPTLAPPLPAEDGLVAAVVMLSPPTPSSRSSTNSTSSAPVMTLQPNTNEAAISNNARRISFRLLIFDFEYNKDRCH